MIIERYGDVGKKAKTATDGGDMKGDYTIESSEYYARAWGNL